MITSNKKCCSPHETLQPTQGWDILWKTTESFPSVPVHSLNLRRSPYLLWTIKKVFSSTCFFPLCLLNSLCISLLHWKSGNLRLPGCIWPFPVTDRSFSQEDQAPLAYFYITQYNYLLCLYTQVISLTAYLDPLSVGLIVMILHLQREFEEILCPPLVSVQIVSHDLGCRTVIFHTSFHTWQLLIPTSPLHDHSRYLPTPKTETKTSCKTWTISEQSFQSIWCTSIRTCFQDLIFTVCYKDSQNLAQCMQLEYWLTHLNSPKFQAYQGPYC